MYRKEINRGRFKYNICTCRATNFPIEGEAPTLFKYNICTCRANLDNLKAIQVAGFKYNICTCRAFF